MTETWTSEKEALRKQLNKEYAKLKRDKTRVRKFSPKPKLCSSLSEKGTASANIK